MNHLPPIIRRIPSIFYGLALLFFVAAWGLSLFELSTTMPGVEPDNPVVRVAKLRGLYDAAREALYIAANGVLAHILLAIWRSRRGEVEAGASND
jgi:hypothetical protein